MTKIVIDIKSCNECPHIKISSDYSTDGWDRGADWYCTKMADIPIAGFVERKKPKVPEWCPCRLNLKEERKLKLKNIDENNN